MKYDCTRLEPVKPSASASVSAAAKAARARGEDVIDLGLGEPDFDTPAHIVEAAHQAALCGETRYPPHDGTRALKKAVCDKLLRDNGLFFDPDEVIVSNGAKQVIFNSMMASLEPGDEVLLCAPYFGSYKDIVLILNGTPISIPCPAHDGFRLKPKALEAELSEKSRWLILNLPSNPSGAVFSKDNLRAIGDIVKRHPRLMVLADEIYEHILFDNQKFQSFLAVCPDLRDRVLTVNGVSKAYAMTGWRIGYGAGPQPLIKAMTKVQSQICSGACSIAQAAAVAALNGPQDPVLRFCKAFEMRRDLVVKRIAAMDGLTLDPPGGAFYALIGCAAFMGSSRPDGVRIHNDINFCQYLLDEAKVAAVPGNAYGLSPFFRISTATSEDVLQEAMDRIEGAIAQLSL